MSLRRRSPRKSLEAQVRAAEAGRASAAAAGVSGDGQVALDPTAAAFFDVDNTMMMGASIFHFARGLAARKFFTTRDVAEMLWQQTKFRVMGSEDKDDIRTSRDKALEFVKGVEVAELVRLGREIYDEEMHDKIYPGTRALAQSHLAAGQRVWLVTATPVELAATIAERLGLTGALGTVAESENGIYTGRLTGEMMHGPAKAEAVSALAEREGLDLSRCTAYSDSVNDVPMLSLVGTAVVVNPDSDLRKEAQERGWEIQDFRNGRKVLKIGAIAAVAGGVLTGFIFGIVSALRHSKRRQARIEAEPTRTRLRTRSTS